MPMADFLASRIHSGIERKDAVFVVTAFWVFSGFLLAIAPSAQAEAPLEFAYPNFPPIHWVAEDGKKSGFFYEIITEALENRMGVKVVWSAYPWPRCQENLKAGKAEAILTVPTEERASYSVTHEFPFYRKPYNTSGGIRKRLRLMGDTP
jgi:polar amino acid transport system substrate-binding protein